MSFSVVSAVLLPDGETVEGPAPELTADEGATEILAITYEFRNESQRRKLELETSFDFSLTDEFGNVYHRVATPPGYAQPTFVANRRFPSFYPGEKISQTVFFQAPVRSAQKLRWHIYPYGIGVEEKIVFVIPSSEIARPYLEKPWIPRDEDLVIVSPAPASEVIAGAKVRIAARVSKEAPAPNELSVLTPFGVFQDPSGTGRYDLLVPADHPAGPLTMVILARWTINGEFRTLSRSVTIQVRPQQLAGQLDRPRP